jgi:hypothetical protein
MSEKEVDPIFHNSPVVMMEERDGSVYAEPCDSYIPLEVLAGDRNVFYVIGACFRPGVVVFATRLEHEHYRPGSGKNCKYRLVIVNWPLDEWKIHWYVVGFPIEDRHTAEALAKECGLRFADGVPCMLSQGKHEFFPMDGPNVYNLENIEGWTPANYQEKMESERERTVKVVEDSVALQKGKVNVEL